MITTTLNVDTQLDKEYTHLFDLADKLINKIIEIKDTKTPPFKLQLEDIERLDGTTDNTEYIITQDTLDSINSLITGAKGGLYEGLFTDADATNIKIDSLAEYFGVLEVLYNIHPRFIRLPLDEAFYTINANERTIIPSQNSPKFAVKGDHVAETIYFKIDRYFDAMDLADATIIIQSQMNNNKYITPINLIDVDSDPDHIIFGWPISNIVTNNSGNLTFAVRFYITDSDTINYSFGTLTQTLPIRDSLFWIDTNDGVTQDTSGLYVKNFIIQGASAIEKPEFKASSSSTKDFYNALNSEIAVEAEANSGATITYAWTYDDKKQISSNPVAYDTYVNLNNRFILTTDETKQDGKTYYEQDTSDSYIDYKATEDETFQAGKKYYEEAKGSRCVPNKPGYYYCTATASVAINKEKKTIGPFKVKAPAPYKFDINESSQLSYDYFVLPPSTDFNKFNIEDYRTNSEQYYVIDDSNLQKTYQGLLDTDFGTGEVEVKNEYKDTTGIKREANLTVQNILNNDTSISDEKTVYVLAPLADSLELQKIIETDESSNKIITITIKSATDNTINGTDTTISDLFNFSYNWKIDNGASGASPLPSGSGTGVTIDGNKLTLSPAKYTELGAYLMINVIATLINRVAVKIPSGIDEQPLRSITSGNIKLNDIS